MFESILSWLQSWTGNYGIAVILFTILVRLVLSPFDYKSRKSMRKTAKLQPKLAVLQKKYANDREKLNRKTQELYKQEHVSPLSGCLPMLLSYPILIIMFNAMRNYANQQTAQQVLTMLRLGSDLNQTNAPLEGFLWIKNLYMADSPVVSRLVDVNTLTSFGAEVWRNVLSRPENSEIVARILESYPQATMLNLNILENVQCMQNYASVMGITDIKALNLDNLTWLSTTSFGDAQNLSNTLNLMGKALASTPLYRENTETGINLFIFGTVKNLLNGFWILPIMSAASQLVMTKLTPTQQQPVADPSDPKAQSQQATGKFMKWFFPIFSLWICASSTAAFALYWVTSNLIMMGTTVAMNKYLDKKEQKDTIAGEGIVQ